MPLRDPVSVYNAANNLEAHLLVNALNESGIEAHVTEDVSQVGVWAFGLLPEIHKPQIWIERTEMERAKPVLEGFERRTKELRTSKVGPGDDSIEIVCGQCGAVTAFPSVQLDSVQNCARCGAYVDVEQNSKFTDGFETDDASASNENE